MTKKAKFPKVTVIGGGTGTFVVLSGLKKYPLDLAVIVSVMDSGGSTGRLHNQLGILPPGDLRQCLVALSEASKLWRKLFLYRFDKGDLAGHNFGNIFLSALEKNTSSYQEVINIASYILKTKGKVIPVTYQKTDIVVQYKSGKIITGEGLIDKNFREKTKVVKTYLKPMVQANPEAIKRINDSDFILIGPGDFYTSLIPNLLVKGIKNAIKKSPAKIIFILNLFTKSGQTSNYKGSDHLKDISFYLGRQPDFIIVNNKKIPKKIINWYSKYSEKLVENDLVKFYPQEKIIKGDIIDSQEHHFSSSEKYTSPLVRSLLRHHPEKLAQLLYTKLLQENSH
ncbi:MAG: YvcK family protein [Patescibacteria group bacterium]|nr:YvcK family protein [Patescibacteria group bacterium]